MKRSASDVESFPTKRPPGRPRKYPLPDSNGNEGDGKKLPLIIKLNRPSVFEKLAQLQMTSQSSQPSTSYEEGEDGGKHSKDEACEDVCDPATSMVSAHGKPLTQCPVVGCRSQGHMNGLDAVHITVSACPYYHNMTPEQCVAMRMREEGGTTAMSNLGKNGSTDSCDNPNGTALSTEELLAHLPPVKYGALPKEKINLKEPTLEEMASPVEIYKFRRAQQRVVSKPDWEVQHHFELCVGTGSEKVDRLRQLVFGDLEMDIWYRSKYPEDVSCMATLHVCPFCLTYITHQETYDRHMDICEVLHPPGDEIYRKGKYSFWEVKGYEQKEYCRNLCLLAKLFLEHKTAYELDNMTHFIFYVLTEVTDNGCQLIGYFSKEIIKYQKKHSGLNANFYYNLSCILTMPQYMRQGFGRMLIEFSYALSKREGRIGSPERPLSDLGLLTYRKYWREKLLTYLNEYKGAEINMRALSEETGFQLRDIVSTLLSMGMVRYIRTEYYVVRKKDLIEKQLRESALKPLDPNKCIDMNLLKWTPDRS